MGDLIWLASYPKSGNTWLRAFLHNYLRQGSEPHNINALRDLTATENDASLYKDLDPRPGSQYSAADVVRMRATVHRALTKIFPGYVFVKTHNALLTEDGLPLMTKEVTAGAIYIVRDPRDVALSYSQYLGLPIDAVIEFMAAEGASAGGTDAHVHEKLGSWSTHVGTWTARPNPRLLVLRYEDMHATPQETFGKVIRFLGGDPPQDRLLRAIEQSAFGQLAAQETAHGFVEKPPEAERFFRSGRTNQWRNALSQVQSSRIERAHATQMGRFGYG